MHATTPDPLPRASRAFAAVVAATAAASLLLQYGLLLAPAAPGELTAATVLFLGYFTILSNLLVVAVCTAAVRGGRGRIGGWLCRARARGAVALYIGVTGLVYGLVLHGLWQPQGLQWWADVGLHRVVPVLYLAWWIAAIPHGRLGARDVAWWLPFPALYLGWSLLQGTWTHVYPYPFIDIGVHGLPQVLRNAAVVAALFVVSGGVLVAVDRLRGRAAR